MPVAVELISQISNAAWGVSADKAPLRLFGSEAVALICNKGQPLLTALQRVRGDIDLLTRFENFPEVREACRRLGLIEDPRNDRNLVAFGRMAFATKERVLVEISGDPLHFHHEVKLGSRLLAVPETLPLAELLISKLQFDPQYFRETNKGRMSLIDVAALLTDYGLSKDDTAVNGRVLAETVSRDWGLTKTVLENLRAVDEFLNSQMVQQVPPALVLEARVHSAEIQKAVLGTRKKLRWHVSEFAHRVLPAIPIGEDVEDWSEVYTSGGGVH